ncbi:protein SHQ1 homolog isoform X2 [Antedon mediterranea]
MLTKLLAPSGQTHIQGASIEVTDSSGSCEPSRTLEDDEEEEIDWQVIQAPYLDDETVTVGNACYGFANKKSGVFNRLQDELCGIVDVKDPDNTMPMNRKKYRMEDEKEHFDEDHYLADLYEDECIQCLLAYKAPWESEYTEMQNKQGQEVDQTKDSGQDNLRSSDKEQIVIFSDDEKEQMRKLPRREILHDKESDSVALLSLVDILFAYAYNYRTTEGDNNVESAWTICKLSSTLSWMNSFASLQDVVEASFRRSICYPLYRHWKLSSKVLNDVKKVFVLGRRRLLKCLLEIHQLLSHDDPRYILNELYITDYCLWIQTVSQRRLESVAKALRKVKVHKDDIGFDLVELEQAAELVLEEEENEETTIEADIQQYGYPEILYTNANSSAVEESVIKTAEEEMKQSESFVTEKCGESAEESVINGIEEFEHLSLKDEHEVLKNISIHDSNGVGKLQKNESNIDNEIKKEGGRMIDVTAQVVEPLSELSIAYDDTVTKLDSKDTDSSDPAFIEWIHKPPVKKIEMFE